MSSILDVPKEILVCALLPYLEKIDLAHLSTTSRLLRSAVFAFLATNKTLVMNDILRLIEKQRWSRSGWSTTTEESAMKKKAFHFFTINASVHSLRKLQIEEENVGHYHYSHCQKNDYSSVTIPPLKKVITANVDLEELILMNMNLTPALIQAISKLTKLKFLKLQPTVTTEKHLGSLYHLARDLGSTYGTICEIHYRGSVSNGFPSQECVIS